jgi:hypothetical protein
MEVFVLHLVIYVICKGLKKEAKVMTKARKTT